MLRVGYNPDRLPFTFFNTAGDLVGFDVEMAHRLARELGVNTAAVGRLLHRARTRLRDLLAPTLPERQREFLP